MANTQKPWTLILTVDRGTAWGPQTQVETTKYGSHDQLLQSKEDAQVAALLWISRYGGMGPLKSAEVEIESPSGEFFKHGLKGMSDAVIEECEREINRLNSREVL